MIKFEQIINIPYYKISILNVFYIQMNPYVLLLTCNYEFKNTDQIHVYIQSILLNIKFCRYVMLTINITVPLTNGQPLVCNLSCVTCEEDIMVCMLCTPFLILEACKYRCTEIWSGSSSQGIQGNCSNNKQMRQTKELKCGMFIICYN